MKVNRKYLIKMITEALIEDGALGEADRKPSPWVSGHIQGNRDAKRLALKGEKQSAKGLRAYIQKATENHPDEKWREGYKFAFQLMFSAQLSEPPSDGQLPYANTRKRPYGAFNPKRGKNPLKENDESEFQKLLDLARQEGEGNAMQAWEMHEYFDFTEEQIEQLRNIVAKQIIYNADEPGKDLIEIGYDFHKDFTEVFGVTPPRDQEFIFNDGNTTLKVALSGKQKLIFTFWFEANNEDHPSDPWIFMTNPEDEYITIESPEAGQITMEIAKRSTALGFDGVITKEDVPKQIKKHTGWSESGGINEKIDRNYLFKMINEVLNEKDEFSDLNEENFGRESRSESILQEAWEDQWPPELMDIALAIQSTVKEPFQEAFSKVFLRTANISQLMPIRFVRAAANLTRTLTESGMRYHKNAISSLERRIQEINTAPLVDFPQEEKDEQIIELQNEIKEEQRYLDLYMKLNSLADDPFYFGKQRRKEVLMQSRAIGGANPNSNMPSMRYINKTIKSIKKQLKKWREKNTDGFPRVNVVVGGILNQFDAGVENVLSSVFDKFEEDMDFLFFYMGRVRGTGKDAAQKLNDWLDKNKDLPLDKYEEGLRLFSVDQNEDYYKNCDEVEEGTPCVFLRLDNGMFWHSTDSEYCEITQSEMNHCGSASESGSILYNLMSSSEGGSMRYHVTIEYNEGQNKVIQVLGKANTLPKEKYWSSITKFFEAVGNPLLSKNDFQHMYDDKEDDETVDQRVKEFIDGTGVSMIPPPAVETWDSMKKQIQEGYYAETVETQPFEGPLRNVFRASIIHGKDDGKKSTLMLNIKMIVQTITNEMYAKVGGQAEFLREERKKLDEYAKSGDLGKEIYNFAIPQKYLDSAREIHLKYSKSSTPRTGVGSNGSYRIQMSFLFDVRTSPWMKARGEYLVDNFEQLIDGVSKRLEKVGLAPVFAVAPDRAAEIYSEEAERRADVEDVLRDLLQEREKKVKLDRNYLTSMITEVIRESSSGKFSTVENANQTLNLYIDAGMLPEPVKMEVNEQWGSIYIKFASNEELQQLIDILDDDGVTQQLGTSAQTPSYFVHKTLVNRRKQFYRSDEEPPKPPPPTGLTLKF